jgi:hypothetical protein
MWKLFLLLKENTYTLEVFVRENRGRYTGNLAKWEVDFTIEREPLSFWEIVKNVF